MRRAKHDARTCFQPFTHNTPRTEAPTLSKSKLKGSARCNHTHAPSESQSTRLQRNANKLSSSSPHMGGTSLEAISRVDVTDVL